MTSEVTRVHEITVPGSTLSHLRQILTEEADAETATRVLHGAGSASGDSLFESLTSHAERDPATLGRNGFWGELTRFLDGRGWGRLAHERIHPGLGLVRSEACGESDPETDSGEPSCAFTAGMLSGIFARLAGSPIAVLEVSCRSQGNGDCAFAFGSEQAVGQLQALLLETSDLKTALNRL